MLFMTVTFSKTCFGCMARDVDMKSMLKGDSIIAWQMTAVRVSITIHNLDMRLIEVLMYFINSQMLI